MPNVSANTREADAKFFEGHADFDINPGKPYDELSPAHRAGVDRLTNEKNRWLRAAHLSRHAAKVQEARNFLQGSLDIALAFERPVVMTHNAMLGLIHLLDAMLKEPDA